MSRTKAQTAATHVPPQNIAMEESVLGAMLITEAAVADVIDGTELGADDLYLDRHQAIFEAIHDLYSGSKPVDEISVAAALNSAQRALFERTGTKPADYLAELVAKVGAPGNAGHHASRLLELSRRRRAIEAAQETIRVASGDAPLNGEVARLGEAVEAIEAGSGELTLVRGSDVRLRVPTFLDAAEMIPTRSLTVVFGAAGLGKTLYSIGQAAAVTSGRMAALDGPAPVLMSSLEDDPEGVLAPRMIAAGGDLSRTHFVGGLSLPSQVPALVKHAKALGAALIVIDPISAHLDADIDSHRDAATRAALAPLAEAAQDLDIAVLVVAHPNKATGARGLDRISGSGAFGNAARSVIVFGLDPGDPEGEVGCRRIIAHLKSNIGRRAPSISAEVATTGVDTEEGVATVPRLRITGLSDHSADDVLASPTGDERGERDEAREFLTEQLADGPVRSKELKRAAESAGSTWRTIERAKRDLGVKAVQGPDGWYWLPVGQTALEGSK